ncbi:hypothetical protein [Mesorhizobium sp. LjNodule214]|uniref:hypothetical protein n=1 Tax=Mesorhizobium sp. LjNodule214 TaxID=3342252 RepID=UPI003ED0BA0E
MNMPGRENRFAPGKLWSLLDMFKFEGAHFFSSMEWLSQLDYISRQDAQFFANERNQKYALECCDKLLVELENLQLPLSIKMVGRLRYAIDIKNNPEYAVEVVRNRYSTVLGELKNRIEDELANAVVYSLSPSEAGYSRGTEPPFGDEVRKCFQDTAFDLEEARKCMSFARWTAVVFHLMRALEVAVGALGKKLSATVANGHGGSLTWGVIIANIAAKIEKLPKDYPNRAAYSQAQALLYHVNQAWRTETMHPKQTYTEEEAKAVYEASGSFMRHLAGLLL